MEEACSSTVQAHDVDSARQMIQQHQDLKKRTSSSLHLCLSVCLSVCQRLSVNVLFVLICLIAADHDLAIKSSKLIKCV